MAAWSCHPEFEVRWKSLGPSPEGLSGDDLGDMSCDLSDTLPTLTTRERGITFAVIERLENRAFADSEAAIRQGTNPNILIEFCCGG